MLLERRLMRQVSWIVGEREQVHLVAGRERPQLMKRANLVPLIGRKRHPVAEEQDSHEELRDLE